MPTAGDLVTETAAQLHGWGSTQDRITPLSLNIGTSDATFTVDFAFGQAVGITPGIVEIGAELLYVTSIDPSTGVCTLANGFGRGYGGTTPVAHLAGTPVISRPKFPRVWLLKQINNIIGVVYPQLFKVNTFTTNVTFPSNTYIIPVAPSFILDAQGQTPIGNWPRCESYVVDPFDSSVRMGGGLLVGRPLRLVYATEPGTFTTESDDFVTVTGLPPSCADVLSLGAVARVIPGLDISRAQTTSVEQSDRSRTVPPFAGVNAAKYIMAEFQDRLKNEAQSLRKLYRSRLVKVW